MESKRVKSGHLVSGKITELCFKGNYLAQMIFNLNCILPILFLINSFYPALTWQTYLGSLVHKDQIAFLKYIWFLKLGISELLVSIQRAHTYSNKPWIVDSERHRCLASERKDTAHFFIGGSDGAIITFKTSLVCPFRKAQVRLCGHSKEEAVKMGPLVTL